MKSETIVMRDSPEAAQPHTMTGWKSRDGFFFAEESVARYAGCTHVACRECGAPTPKNWTACDACREKGDDARHAAREKREWDGVQMIYSEVADRYFSDPGEVFDFCEGEYDGETHKAEELRLVLCEPLKPRHIDANDYCQDVLADDGEVEDADFLAACDALNAAIDKMPPTAWEPGKYALDIEATEDLK